MPLSLWICPGSSRSPITSRYASRDASRSVRLPARISIPPRFAPRLQILGALIPGMRFRSSGCFSVGFSSGAIRPVRGRHARRSGVATDLCPGRAHPRIAPSRPPRPSCAARPLGRCACSDPAQLPRPCRFTPRLPPVVARSARPWRRLLPACPRIAHLVVVDLTGSWPPTSFRCWRASNAKGGYRVRPAFFTPRLPAGDRQPRREPRTLYAPRAAAGHLLVTPLDYVGPPASRLSLARLAFIAAALSCSSAGPVIFRQRRCASWPV